MNMRATTTKVKMACQPSMTTGSKKLLQLQQPGCYAVHCETFQVGGRNGCSRRRHRLATAEEERTCNSMHAAGFVRESVVQVERNHYMSTACSSSAGAVVVTSDAPGENSRTPPKRVFFSPKLVHR